MAPGPSKTGLLIPRTSNLYDANTIVTLSLTAASIIRMTTLPKFGQVASDWCEEPLLCLNASCVCMSLTSFLAATYFYTAVWSFVELSVGVIVACLPAARIVVRRYAGSIAESSGLRSTDQTRTRSSSFGDSVYSRDPKRRSARRWTEALQPPAGTTRLVDARDTSWFDDTTTTDKGNDITPFSWPLRNEPPSPPGPVWVMKDLTEGPPGSPGQYKYRPEEDVGYSVSIQYRSQ